jgi:hypothetical protein
MTGIDSRQRLTFFYGCGPHPAIYTLGTETSLRSQPADRSADYSSPSGAEIKNAWSYYPTPHAVSKRDAEVRFFRHISQFAALNPLEPEVKRSNMDP